MQAFNYQLLGRLQADCEYFLGNGNGHVKHLFHGSTTEHIDGMLELHNDFPANKKPEWLTIEQIHEYKKNMLALEASTSTNT